MLYLYLLINQKNVVSFRKAVKKCDCYQREPICVYNTLSCYHDRWLYTQGLTIPMNELFVNKTCTLRLQNYMVYITLILIGIYFVFFLICHCFFELTPPF